MDNTTLNEEIRLAISKGIFFPRKEKENVILPLWGGELVLTSEPNGSGTWFFSDTAD